MEWLNEKLYSSNQTQTNWSESDWSDVWAQIIHFINDAMINIPEDAYNKCKTDKEKRFLKFILNNKQYAENEIHNWDISKMSTNIKAIIKADLMQRRYYYTFLHKFPNLKNLDDINRLEKPLILNSNGIEPFNWYYNMNIKV